MIKSNLSGNKPKILWLPLKGIWFDIMVTGEKRFEIRKDCDWLRSRLYDKNGEERNYDYVGYTRGYGSSVPMFLCKYNGFTRNRSGCIKFSNNIFLVFGDTDFMIFNGPIMKKANL